MKEGWQSKRLGDLFTFKNGRAFKKEEWSDQGLPIIRIQNLNREDAPFNCFAGEYSLDILVEPGDLLFSWSGTVGTSFGSHIWGGSPGLLNQHIFKVKHREIIDKRFAFYGLRYVTAEIEKSVSGAVGLVHITKEKLNEFMLSLPPLPEQQRIVALLDEAFAGLASAKANAEQNLQNARALLESHRESIFSRQGEGWIEMPLSELCDVKHGYAFEGRFFSSAGDYILLTPGNFYEHGGYRDRGEKQKYFIGEIPKEYVLNEGDLLVAMTEQAKGLLGSPILVPESGKFLHNQRLGLVKRKTETPWTNEFFFHVFNTRHLRSEIQASASGVKVRHTSPSKIGNILVSFPGSLDEQRNIVSRLTSLTEETQHLAHLYERKLAALEGLKNSLLRQTFNGEL